MADTHCMKIKSDKVQTVQFEKAYYRVKVLLFCLNFLRRDSAWIVIGDCAQKLGKLLTRNIFRGVAA